jgi:DNA-binding NtrC family response regulator
MSGAPTRCPGLTGFYVLVVEDEYYQAKDCCEWLRSAGATVAGPVSSCADAKHILDRARVDAAVVDINLGQGPDFQVASQLTRKGVPFIFATGYDENVIPAEFQQALTIRKPIDRQDLIAAVTSLR